MIQIGGSTPSPKNQPTGEGHANQPSGKRKCWWSPFPVMPNPLLKLLILGAILGAAIQVMAQNNRQAPPATLGLESGLSTVDSGGLTLDMVKGTGVAVSLRPKSEPSFDFLPNDRLKERESDGFVHLGDLRLHYRRDGEAAWRSFSTFAVRTQGKFPHQFKAEGLEITRSWEKHPRGVKLSFTLRNSSDRTLEIGSLGVPMPFNNWIEGRSLEEAHAKCSFTDAYIGLDAGWLRVVKLSGTGEVLTVTPLSDAPLEAWHLVKEPKWPNQVFEGMMEWMVHTKALAETEWKGVKQWNDPTSGLLKPNEARTCSFLFSLAKDVRSIEAHIASLGIPVAHAIPGTILPMDQKAKLFLKHASALAKAECDPPGALVWKDNKEGSNGWKGLTLQGRKWGRARLTLTYLDGRVQTVHVMATKPASVAVADLGRFQTTKAWFADKSDPFGRAPSPISYDREADRQVTQDSRVWIAGLGDEGGNGSWLSLVMKNFGQPEPSEVSKLEDFINEVLWGRLQYSEGPLKYGVRKSVFYYDPKALPNFPYDKDRNWTSWTSWNKEHAGDIGRAFNYPHVVAAYWCLYQIARSHPHLVKRRSWQWYLEQAYHTTEFLTSKAPEGHDRVGYMRLGLMEGSVFVRLMEDLEREGLTAQAALIKERMLERASRWKQESYPFGSEMAWDSTGQEEVYAWCRQFGFDDKALVTINSVLAYTPAMPHWGYNGCARRYWDFLYGGKLSRIERQLHHYGSGMNAVPLLTHFRDNPGDLFLLQVGYGGMMGAISAIDQEGFGSCAFHSFPSTLKWDAYSGDYGPNFFGHTWNTGTYLVKTPDFGWQAYGGEVSAKGKRLSLKPQDSYRKRVYLAHLGLYLTLDSGVFDMVEVDLASGRVLAKLAEGSGKAKTLRLRVEQPGQVAKVGAYSVNGALKEDAGAILVPMRSGRSQVVLTAK